MVNRNNFVIAGIGIIFALLLFVLFDPSTPLSESINESVVSSDIQSKTKSPDIDYSTTAQNNQDNHSSDSENHTVAKKKVREKYLEALAFDSTGTFEIALINPNQDTSLRVKKYFRVSGTIDGKGFNLNIPDYVLTQDTNSISLRVRNVKDETVSTVPAYFLDTLADTSQRHFININSHDVQNMQYETKTKILPLPGTEEE